MGETENTENHPQPQEIPQINQQKVAKENNDTHPPPQTSPDVNEEEEFEVTAVEAEEGASTVRIPKMEAICEICYSLLQEDAIVIKTKCKCDSSLVHEQCRKENTTCDVCDQTITYIRVKLTMPKRKYIEVKTSPKRRVSQIRKMFSGGFKDKV